jgi:undecaprenyl diphosphate synthase
MEKKIPYHVAIITDGNRRWAKKHGLSSLDGHLAGYKNFKRILKHCQKRGVKVLTAFGFSSENWKRSNEEVDYLMRLLEKGLSNEKDIKELNDAGVKIKIIGQKEKLPKSLQKVMQKVENLTKNNKKFHVNLAVSYGGKWDILQAVQKIMKKKIPAEKVNEDLISKYISTAGLPEPDLIIRAGGERRLSNFLLWQTAYSELYFTSKFWPELSEKELDKAFNDFADRNRRFGGDINK